MLYEFMIYLYGRYYPDEIKDSLFQADNDEIEPLFPANPRWSDQDDLELNQAEMAGKKPPFHIFQAVSSSQPAPQDRNSKSFHSHDNSQNKSLPTTKGTNQSGRASKMSSKASTGFHAPLLTVPTRNPEKATKRTQEVRKLGFQEATPKKI